MRPNFRIGTFALVSTIAMVLTGCGDSKPSAVEAPPFTVTVTKPIKQTITNTQEFTGTINAKESVQIRARVSGYLDKVGYVEGKEVKAGDVLFIIDQRPFQADLDKAQAVLDEAESKLKLATVDFGRAQDLFKQSVISAQEFDTRSANFASAKANVDSNKASVETAKLNLSYTTVLAPVAGKTSKANVTVGNLISPSDVLTTLVSIDPIYVYFNVDERTLLKYLENKKDAGDNPQKAKGSSIGVALAGQTGFPYVAKIDYDGNQMDANSGTFSVRGVLDNKERIFVPGFFARVSVPMGAPFEAFLIPDRAIGSTQGQPYIYLVNAENVVMYQKITTGVLTPAGLRVINYDGIKDSDTIVVDGIQSVRPGSKVKTESFVQETKKLEAAEAPAPPAPAEPKK